MNAWNIRIDGSKEVWVYHNERFVARFKYMRPKTSARKFVNFLVKNFSPDEYFGWYDAGYSPLTILETKGFAPR